MTTYIEGFPWQDDPELHEVQQTKRHSQHRKPVIGCLLCEDQMAEARELYADEAKP